MENNDLLSWLPTGITVGTQARWSITIHEPRTQTFPLNKRGYCRWNAWWYRDWYQRSTVDGADNVLDGTISFDVSIGLTADIANLRVLGNVSGYC